MICRGFGRSAILLGMSDGRIQIVPCPPALIADAFALALSELAPDQRRELIAPVVERAKGGNIENLIVALDGDELRGAAWGQRHPGNTAVVWLPPMVEGSNAGMQCALVDAVVASLSGAGVRMIQILLPDRGSPLVPLIEAAGFEFLVELWYLHWEAPGAFSDGSGERPLEFIAYDETQRGRLASSIERTYFGTHDCPAMNGRRTIDEVLEGYRSTGTFRPGNWWIARAEGQDVGVLLLAEHSAEHWELMYMGLAPEARGRGWGREIVRHAQREAIKSRIERIVLAVDGLNLPAMKMYRDAGFMAWDRRTVYVRFVPNSSSTSA
jgi:mycothiol synthase